MWITQGASPTAWIQGQCTGRLNVEAALVNTCCRGQNFVCPQGLLAAKGFCQDGPKRSEEQEASFIPSTWTWWERSRTQPQWLNSILIQFRYGTQDCKGMANNKESIFKQERCSYSFGSHFLYYTYIHSCFMISIPHARNFVLLHWDSNNEEVKSRLILSNLKAFISPLAFRDHSFSVMPCSPMQAVQRNCRKIWATLCSQSAWVLSKYFWSSHGPTLCSFFYVQNQSWEKLQPVKFQPPTLISQLSSEQKENAVQQNSTGDISFSRLLPFLSSWSSPDLNLILAN